MWLYVMLLLLCISILMSHQAYLNAEADSISSDLDSLRDRVDSFPQPTNPFFAQAMAELDAIDESLGILPAPEPAPALLQVEVPVDAAALKEKWSSLPMPNQPDALMMDGITRRGIASISQGGVTTYFNHGGPKRGPSYQ